jgi:uncharacterized protein YbjT (DUF2867 family)
VKGTEVPRRRPPVLVTGATGFVGRALVPALLAAGHRVRATARRVPARAGRRVDWVAADLARAEDLPRLLAGVRVAYFLVHGMSGGGDFPEVERRIAAAFAREAARAGVARIVYLGGPRPQGRASRHLASRLAVGEVLRAGPVPALELRASMIVGAGSASWQLVRDLALRLPALVLPAWARARTRPVAIDDVLAALVAALDVPLPEGGAVADLPGPEALSVREILERVAALRGRALPAVEAPLPLPRLSALGLKLVSDADFRVARELALGLGSDLLPADGASFWRSVRRRRLVRFDVAARRALAAERPGAGLRAALRALGEELVAAVAPAPPRPSRPPGKRSFRSDRRSARGAPRRGSSGK